MFRGCAESNCIDVNNSTSNYGAADTVDHHLLPYGQQQHLPPPQQQQQQQPPQLQQHHQLQSAVEQCLCDQTKDELTLLQSPAVPFLHTSQFPAHAATADLVNLDKVDETRSANVLAQVFSDQQPHHHHHQHNHNHNHHHHQPHTLSSQAQQREVLFHRLSARRRSSLRAEQCRRLSTSLHPTAASQLDSNVQQTDDFRPTVAPGFCGSLDAEFGAASATVPPPGRDGDEHDETCCLDSFVVQLHKLLEVTGKLVVAVARSRRDQHFNSLDQARRRTANLSATAEQQQQQQRQQPRASTTISTVCRRDASSPTTTTSFSGLTDLSAAASCAVDTRNGQLSAGGGLLLSQSYVYAIFSLNKFTPQLSYASGNVHPICGHLKSDLHVVEKAWYYMRRLRANFVTSLRQKMRHNKHDFRFIGCCESPDKNIAVLNGLSKLLRRDYPAHCFNVQGHVISMSLLHSSIDHHPPHHHHHHHLGGGDKVDNEALQLPPPPSDAYIFNNMLLVVRQRAAEQSPVASFALSQLHRCETPTSATTVSDSLLFAMQ